jgi:hypothetical protein
VVGGEDAVGDGEAEAGSARGGVSVAVSPVEGLEEVGEVVGGDPRPRVGHAEPGPVCGGAARHHDPPTRWRVADGVLDQVGGGARELLAVGLDRTGGVMRPELQRQTGGVGLRTEALDEVVQLLGQVDQPAVG